LSPDRTPQVTQFPLRLAKSLRETAKEIAEREGISLNHFISIAVAEKVSRIESQASSAMGQASSKKESNT
jgi:predicted HicB family RNase H-like nuclease